MPFLLYVLTVFQSGRKLLKKNLRQLLQAFYMQSFAEICFNKRFMWTPESYYQRFPLLGTGRIFFNTEISVGETINNILPLYYHITTTLLS